MRESTAARDSETVFRPSCATDDAQSRVVDVMLRHPKTLQADATIDQARAALRNDHVHMVLLTDGPQLVGTLVRSDLTATNAAGPASSWASLSERTVGPQDKSADVQQMLIERGLRRVAVVDETGALVGLMCLKRHQRAFCSDADVMARVDERALQDHGSG